MAIPQGTQKIIYSFSVGSNPDLALRLETASMDGDVNTAHAALQAGADAIVAHLKAAFPGQTVNASRSYEGTVQGDPWPAP